VDLLPSDEQTQIIDVVAGFLAANAPVSRFRDAHRQVGNDDAELWAGLAELGLIGAALPEAAGGVGLGATDEALLYREFGRALISPAVLGMTLGARVAWLAGDETLKDDILTARTTVCLANPRGRARIGAVCSGGFQLFDGDADWVLVVGEDGAGLLPRAVFKGFERVMGTDSLLSLDRGELPDIRPTAWVPAATEPLHIRATLLLGAYAVGMAEAAKDMAVQYAGMREQFGRPIGAFQAVKHKCANMAIRAEAALCQSWMAAAVLQEGGEDAAFQARACKIVAVDAAMRNAAENIQVHGAIGFTAEIDAHLFVKRTHVIDALGGDVRHQKAALLREPAPA
jgi:alkylation response protein AidB-like acyl-CoA dehydrogenase